MYSLLNDFKKFVKIIENQDERNIIDLTNYDFLGATTLLPLFSYSIENNIDKFIFKSNDYLIDHLNKILQKKPHDNTSLPFEELPKGMSIENAENFASDFTENIMDKLT